MFMAMPRGHRGPREREVFRGGRTPRPTAHPTMNGISTAARADENNEPSSTLPSNWTWTSPVGAYHERRTEGNGKWTSPAGAYHGPELDVAHLTLGEIVKIAKGTKHLQLVKLHMRMRRADMEASGPSESTVAFRKSEKPLCERLTSAAQLSSRKLATVR